MNHHTIHPVAQNNRSTPSATSAQDNQLQPTEACEQVCPMSNEDRIKVQSCLALALTEASYKLGYFCLQQYAIFQRHINSEQPETIDTLMSRAEAMPIRILKDKAYQAIALKEKLDFYFRVLALEKISDPINRLAIGLEALKVSRKSCTLEGYYRILQDLLPEEWKTNGSSLEIDPSNPLSLNELGREALRGLDLGPHINQIQLLSEEELQSAFTQLDDCYSDLFKKDLYSEALSKFLTIATSPYVYIDSVSNKVLNLLRKIQKQSKFVPAGILEKVPQIYSSLIKEGFFFPIVRLEILKTMGEYEAKKQLAEYLLVDPSSPIMLELKIFKSSTIEMPIAITYLECIELLQDDSKRDHLLETIYQLPIFNHTTQFYLLLLGLENSEMAKHLIQQTENKATDPNYPESRETIEGKYKALVSAKELWKLGIRNLGEAQIKVPISAPSLRDQ